MAELPSGTVTFLLTDVEGSTALWEEAPETMRAALARHDELLRAAIVDHGGHVVKTTGDGFHAAFARGPDAVAAALAAQRRLLAEPWGEVGPVRVRMALHTGVTEERDGDYYGPPLNRAARLLATGHGGQVLLSEVTAGLVRDTLPDGLNLLDLGEHRLKDLIRPERVFQLDAPDLPGRFPPLRTLDARQHNLPIHPTTLLGREREVGEITALLRGDARLVTLTGPGGTGKTRLSLQVAAELADVMPDGVFFVELAPISDPRLFAPTVAQMLEIEGIGARPALDALVDFLRERRLLLLLDNFEQVLPAADDVAALLRGCPGLKLLVTSRAVLHVRGECEYPVPPLALPAPNRPSLARELASYPALDLFVQRATEARPSFGVTDESVAVVAEICRRLDGLPLAIELAAARVKLLAPQAMLARLERRLPLLTGGARDLPERQRTLRNTIAWSYDLLDEPECRLYRRLAVFVGGCTLEAVESVCNADGDLGIEVFDGIASLIDKSLVRQEDGADGEPRFTMLETIREYGLEQLQASGEEAASRRRHLAWFSDFATVGQAGIHGPDGVRWTDRLAADHDNARTALAWSLADSEPTSRRSGLVMAGALFNFWVFREHFQEGRRWLEQLLQAGDSVLAVNGPPGTEPPSSPDRIDASTLARIGAYGVHPRVIGLSGVAGLTQGLGDRESARSICRTALELARRVEDRVGEGIAYSFLGASYWRDGDLEQAIPLLETGLAVARSVGQPFGLWLALSNLGLILVTAGQGDRGRAVLDEALAAARRMGHPWGVSQAQRFLGVEALQRGEIDRATALLTESLNGWRAIGASQGVRETCWVLGYAALAANDPHVAIDWFMESAALCRERSDRQRLGLALQGLAAAAITASDASAEWSVKVVRLLGGARRLRGGILSWFPLLENAIHDRTIAATRHSLGDESFDAAWSEGETLVSDYLWALAEDLARRIRGDLPESAPAG